MNQWHPNSLFNRLILKSNTFVRFSDYNFKNTSVDIHYMDNMNGNTLPGIGGAVFVYDCSQSDVKNQEK